MGLNSRIVENKVAQKIADFIVNIDYRHIPQEAIDIAKNAICDCIGVAVAGANEPVAKILTKQVKQMGLTGEAGVICGGFRTSADLAAWINATISHALDYDDASPNSMGYNFHPTVAILPAIMALAEKCEATGKDVLSSYMCGAELEFSLGSTIGKYISKLGWHPTAILGLMGAAGASAKMLKLNSFQIKMAMGIASSLTGGLMRNAGSMTKPLHAGNAARNGILAALLAKNGFTSNENILEGQFGFCDIFSGAKADTLVDEGKGLGSEWEIVSKGISFKPYPCCRGSHSSIDAALYLRERYKIHVEEIEKVTCQTSSMIPQLLAYHLPKSGNEAKFSLEYCVATSLLRGKPRLEDFTDERVNDSTVQDLLSTVSYTHPEGWVGGTDLTQEVIIKLKNGIEYKCKVSIPKGEPENPMTRDELLDKFKNCVGTVLSQNKSEYVLQVLINLDSFDAGIDLMDSLTYLAKDERK